MFVHSPQVFRLEETGFLEASGVDLQRIELLYDSFENKVNSCIFGVL